MDLTVQEIDQKAQTEWLSGNSPKELSIFYGDYKFRYPERFRSSTFVYLFSMIEDHYNDLCKLAKEVYRTEISVTDMKGNGLKRARLYISKISGFDQWDNGQWILLQKYQAVRNGIVHAQGHIKKPKDIEGLQGAKVVHGSELELDESFPLKFIEFIGQHLPQALQKISTYMHDKFFKYVQ